MRDRDREDAPRHVEVPVLVDATGKTWAPGAIDTTLRHQGRVVLAESPPPGMPAPLERSLRSTAAGLARPGAAAGAATVLFQVDIARGEFRYVESVPGLPAAHALVEATTGLDLAARQVHLSRGGQLKGEPPEPRGHAVQVCLSALDPEAGFAPSPGIVELLRPAAGAGLRADPEVEEGESPAAPLSHPSHHAPVLVRLTAHGGGRAEALDRLQRGLARTVVTVSGGATDKAFLAEILDRLATGAASTRPDWLDRLVASGEHLPRRGAQAALVAAAIDSCEAALDLARARFLASAARGRPEVPLAGSHGSALRHRGRSYEFAVQCLEPLLYRVEVDGRRFEARVGPRGRTGRSLAFGRRRWQVRADAQGRDLLVEVDGIPHRIGHGESEGEGTPAAGERVRFDAPAAAAGGGTGATGGLAEVRRLMLGYDFDPREVERQLAALPMGGAPSTAALKEILGAFADVAALFTQATGVDVARHSAEEYLSTYLRNLDAGGLGLPPSFLGKLRQAVAHYGVKPSLERTPELEESLFRIALSHRHRAHQVPPVLALLERLLGSGHTGDTGDTGDTGAELRDLLDRMIAETQGREPAVYDLAREVRYRGFDRPLLAAVRDRAYAAADADLARLAGSPEPEERAARIRALVECTQPLHRRLSQGFDDSVEAGGPALRQTILEVMLRRYYRIHPLSDVQLFSASGHGFVRADYEHQVPVRVLATHAEHARLAAALAAVRAEVETTPREGREVAVDLYLWRPGSPVGTAASPDAVAAEIAAHLAQPGFPAGLRRVAVSLSDPAGVEHFTFRPTEAGYAEDRLQRGLHPMMAQRLELWRLGNFRLGRLPSPEGVYLFHGVAAGNPRDERLFALAEVRDFTPVRDAAGRVVQLPELEHMLMESLAGIRLFQARRPAGQRLLWNRVLLYAWPPVDLAPTELSGLVQRMSPLAHGLGLEKVAVRCRIPDREGGALREWVLEISNPGEGEMTLRFRKPSAAPLKPLREYAQKVVELRRRGLVYPYEVIKRLAPPRQEAQADLPAGDFTEHDLAASEDEIDGTGRLVPVDRPYGGNTAGIIAGVVRNYTGRYPEGMARVILLADPGHGRGTLGEPECRRIVAALDLAAEMGVPVDWFAVSTGADGEAGDWSARVLRRIVGFTRAGGEINLVVHGLNAGAQSFWNAAATTLMHTRGTLILTPEGAMVLAGARAEADAEAEAERSPGPSGPAQYFARDLGEACRLLLAHHEHTYRAPGERFPRPAPTSDPRERDVRALPPFEIRGLMAALADQDHPPLERWYGMRDAETAVVWEVHLGGHPVCLLGFESKPLPRLGTTPADGPDCWTGGTLFPRAAKKAARAIGAASGSRPLVVLASLSEVDGSPESMRAGQLEYAAEIARAVVDFAGPIVLVVLDRCHEAASLIFSPALNDSLEVAMLAALPPERLRPYLIEAIERGLAKALASPRE
jgi:hypothetical protein